MLQNPHKRTFSSDLHGRKMVIIKEAAEYLLTYLDEGSHWLVPTQPTGSRNQNH